MTRSDWMVKGSPLTQQQRRIINDKTCPLRIHGPAGSGKTLVLILKALSLLAKAQIPNDDPCKILFILHNNQVCTNVRAAMDAIDETGFLATTCHDKQFLDVETLHGWCIRELKIDTGQFDYALHSDPVISKARQDKILDEALEKALLRKRSFISKDLCAYLDGPREKLALNLRHEIAIRIKGRGLRDAQQLYVKSPLKSFVGRAKNEHDRYFIFKIAQDYECKLKESGRLDTDDIVLSMQSRLSAPLWNRQRALAGYDYVFVDETHLFNENERRVLPYLTRGLKDSLPIIMTFDEAQSIGGRRATELEAVGIANSQKRRLGYVHRCSPEIYKLARDLVERTSLMFREFSGGEATARMSERDKRKCLFPTVKYVENELEVARFTAKTAIQLRAKNYPRVGIIGFNISIVEAIHGELLAQQSEAMVLRERGDSSAGKPQPGTFLMIPEICGGLEFDAVLLAGVDQGQVPPSLHNMSPEGHMSAKEEACRELYTAITRARYHLAFICNRSLGASEFIKPWIEGGLVVES